MEKKQILCDTCSNNDICKYAIRAAQLEAFINRRPDIKIEKVENEEGVEVEKIEPVTFNLNVNCPKYIEIVLPPEPEPTPEPEVDPDAPLNPDGQDPDTTLNPDSQDSNVPLKPGGQDPKSESGDDLGEENEDLGGGDLSNPDDAPKVDTDLPQEDDSTVPKEDGEEPDSEHTTAQEGLEDDQNPSTELGEQNMDEEV